MPASRCRPRSRDDCSHSRSARAASEPENSRGREIAGVVCDEKKQPSAGATVWLVDATAGASGKDGAIVLEKTRTNKNGHFHVTLPRDWLQTPWEWRVEPGLLAHQPGHRPTGVILDRESMPPESGITLTLRPAARADFRLLQPDGKPLAGCAVTAKDLAVDHVRGPVSIDDTKRAPTRSIGIEKEQISDAVPQGRVIRSDHISLPADLATILNATSDAQGHVRLPDLTLADIAGIRTASSKFGRQEFTLSFNPRTQKWFKPWPSRLSVYPVGKVVGRLIAEPASSAGNQRFLLSSFVFSAPREKGMTVVGVASMTSDAQGKFEVPALAAGSIYAQSFVPGKLLLEFVRKDPTILKEGETLKLELPLKPTVHVRGLTRERGTGKPLAHVRLATYLRGQPLRFSERCSKPMRRGASPLMRCRARSSGPASLAEMCPLCCAKRCTS